MPNISSSSIQIENETTNLVIFQTACCQQYLLPFINGYALQVTETQAGHAGWIIQIPYQPHPMAIIFIARALCDGESVYDLAFTCILVPTQTPKYEKLLANNHHGGGHAPAHCTTLNWYDGPDEAV